MPSTCVYSAAMRIQRRKSLPEQPTCYPVTTHCSQGATCTLAPNNSTVCQPDWSRTRTPQYDNRLVKQPHALRLAFRHIARKVHLQPTELRSKKLSSIFVQTQALLHRCCSVANKSSASRCLYDSRGTGPSHDICCPVLAASVVLCTEEQQRDQQQVKALTGYHWCAQS